MSQARTAASAKHRRGESMAPAKTQEDPEVKIEIIGFDEVDDPTRRSLKSPGEKKHITIYHISIKSVVLSKVLSRPWRHFVELYDKVTAVTTQGNDKPLVMHNLTTVLAKLTFNPKKKRTERKKQGEAWLNALWSERRLRYFVCQFLETDFEVLCPKSAEIAKKDHDKFRKQQQDLQAQIVHGNVEEASKKAFEEKKKFMDKTTNEFLYCLIDLGMSKSFPVPEGVLKSSPPPPGRSLSSNSQNPSTPAPEKPQEATAETDSTAAAQRDSITMHVTRDSVERLGIFK